MDYSCKHDKGVFCTRDCLESIGELYNAHNVVNKCFKYSFKIHECLNYVCSVKHITIAYHL